MDHTQLHLGISGARFIAVFQSLPKIFDAQRVQQEVDAQVQVTQTFSTLAPRAVATYADGQIKAINEQLQHEADDGRRAALLADKTRWGEGGAYRVMLHTAAGGLGGNLAGAAGAGVAATAAPMLNDWQAKMASALTDAGMNPTLAQGVAGQVTGLAAAGLGAAASGPAGAGAAWAADANNRQLHPSERDWAKQNAQRFAQHYKEKTGQDISHEQAERMLLGIGYRMVDAAASKGPGIAGPANDSVAVSFISQNAGPLFKATVAGYHNPGKLGGPLAPEQRALPASEGNPAVGLTVAGLIATGGVAVAAPELALAGRSVVKVAADAWTAYRNASAAYSTTAAAGAGAVIGGGTYTGSAALEAFFDAKFSDGPSFETGFEQRFSLAGLGGSMVIGSATGVYGTTMFRWARIPNAFSNISTVPGVVIRVNSAAMGKAAGSAVHGAPKQSTDR